MAYADKDQLIADYLPDARSNAEKDAVERILDNATAFVDTYCRRVSGYFNPSPIEPSMKRLRGEGNHFLRLPVHVFGSITEINGETFESLSSSIYESDKNSWLYFEDEGFGIESGFESSGCNRIWQDGRIYKIHARWGYAETPKDLQEAVRLIVARIYSIERGTLGQITPEGFIQERFIPSAAKDILDRYKRREFEI